MVDRNQVKIIIHVLKKAPRRILTYLESNEILKIALVPYYLKNL